MDLSVINFGFVFVSFAPVRAIVRNNSGGRRPSNGSRHTHTHTQIAIIRTHQFYRRYRLYKQRIKNDSAEHLCAGVTALAGFLLFGRDGNNL